MDLDNQTYLACCVQPVAPVFVEERYRGHVTVLKPVTPVEPLMKAALRSCKCFIDASNLKFICHANKIPKPEGTGKKGKKGKRGVLKKDWANALVMRCFPDLGAEEQRKIIGGILGNSPGLVSDSNVDEVCEELNQLDDENRRAFSKVDTMAQKIQHYAFESKVREDALRAGRGAVDFYLLSFKQTSLSTNQFKLDLVVVTFV